MEPVAVEIAAVDRATGASVADSVTGTLAVSGATVALGPRQLDPGGAPVTLAGGTGPGTYAIYLKHPRFLDWDSTGVIVAKGRGCQPFTPVTLTARLTRR